MHSLTAIPTSRQGLCPYGRLHYASNALYSSERRRNLGILRRYALLNSAIHNHNSEPKLSARGRNSCGALDRISHDPIIVDRARVQWRMPWKLDLGDNISCYVVTGSCAGRIYPTDASGRRSLNQDTHCCVAKSIEVLLGRDRDDDSSLPLYRPLMISIKAAP